MGILKLTLKTAFGLLVMMYPIFMQNQVREFTPASSDVEGSKTDCSQRCDELARCSCSDGTLP